MTGAPGRRPVGRRSVLRLAAGAAGGLALGGCEPRGLTLSSGSTGTLEMAFWGEGDQNTRLIAAINLYQKSADGVPVKMQYSGLQGYYDKLATRLAGGAPPDIFQIHLPYLLEYAERGSVHQLDQYAAELGLPSLPPSVSGTARIDGHWYFAVVGAATQPAVVQNRTLLARLGLDQPDPSWTLDGYEAQMKRVRSASGGKLYGCADAGAVIAPLDSYLRGFGKRLFDGHGGLGFGPEQFQEWLGFWDRLRREQACVPMEITAGATGFQTDPVVTRKAVYSLTATSRGLPSIQSLTNDRLSLLTFPAANATSGPGTNVIPAGWFAISSKSRNVEEAVGLLRFLATSAAAAKTMGLARGVPISPQLQAVVSRGLDGLDQQVFDNYRTVTAGAVAPLQPFPVGAGELLTTSLTNANQTVGFGRATVQQATDRFFAEAKRLIT